MLMKRILAIVCVFAVVLSVTVALMVPVSAEQADFEVGFARVDINPYKDPTKTGRDLTDKSNIMQLPLQGTGDVWNRLSTGGILEDNGKVDKYWFWTYTTEEDGLSVTCIAVTDADGNTVLMISIDLLYSYLADRAKEKICTRVEEALASGELSNVELTKEQIYFTATHTHNAPDTSAYKAGMTGTNDAGVDLSVVSKNLDEWIERTIENIGESAILALKDRAPAKLYKDQISASELTAGVASGKVMNSNRHYNNAEDGCVAGDNFNTIGDNPKQVTPVNDTMYLLEFDFTEYNKNSGDNKLNIVLANWRGHPSLNLGGYPNHISSDYVSAFRHTLEYGCAVQTNGKETCDSTQDYRVAFFNGAGGNVNPRSYEKTDGVRADAWIDTFAETIDGAKGIGYGRVLAVMAKAGLKDKLHREEVTAGNIRTCRYVYNSTRKTTGVSALAYEAAKAFQAASSAGTATTPYVYTSPTTGETFVISSQYHADVMSTYWDPTLQMPRDAIVDLELNVFMLGDDVAFVTTAGEAFDYYYNSDGTNAWGNLVADTYGTPFVLGYCNGGKSYIPNSRAYDYNQGSKQWSTGCYESNLTYYEKGTGEHMIELFDQILETLATKGTMTREKTCEHCNQPVIWKNFDGDAKLYTGHYYLIDDARSVTMSIQAGQQVCLDLNGCAYEGQFRAVELASGGTVLSVMDLSDNKTGKLMGSGGSLGAAGGYGGSTVYVDGGNTFNLYSGTLTYQQRGVHSARTGGVVDTRGTFNMYGGTITGGVGYSFTGTYLKSGAPSTSAYEGLLPLGATVFSNGQFNMYGGKIDSGEFKLITGTVSGDATNGYTYSQTLTPTQGTGCGIYSHTYGSVKISGDAVIEDVYFNVSSADKFVIDASSKPFTGSVRLDYAQELTSGTDIGNCTEGMTLNANAITFANSEMGARVQGTNLYIMGSVAILDAAGNATEYGTLEGAIADYVYSPEDLNYVKLYDGVDANLTLTKDLYLDLNGYNLGGALTVDNGATLYCMDSQTDDYTVEDEAGYGKITGTYTGNIQAVPANSVGAVQDNYRDPYYAVKEADGLSFHRLKLRLPTLSLRPDEVGMYYTGAFGGDELIAKEVVSFGVILNAYEEPTLNSIASFWTAADAESWTNDGKLTSVLLTGVMKQNKTDAVNASNANRPIYGRAYVRTKDGYIFSNTISYSLKQLVEKADATGTIQGSGFTKLVAMYQKYANVMNTWNIPNFRQDMENAG